MANLNVPFYYNPRPQQQQAWVRRLSGKYDYYFKIWHRQFGKDTDDIQYAYYNGYTNPGTQSAYVGPDNKWIRRNIWDKYLDGRHHWDSYPENEIEIAQTAQQIKFLNNPKDKAPALIQFIGFKESEVLVGSSYDNFYISELSLYDKDAFNFIQPIWDNRKAMGEKFSVSANFTPRGLSNNAAAKMLRAYTGKEDPADWPGDHGNVYVDVIPATQSLRADGTRVYSDEALEQIRDRHILEYGNDNLFRQEFLCDFLTVNAGLVFPGIEALRREGRYHSFNLDPRYPVYCAWDISSKGKESDWTAAWVFQYYEGHLWLYDYFEDNRLAVVECVQELAKRDYFHLIRGACLPWDSDRSGSVFSPINECMKAFPNITWNKLSRDYVADGIARGRKLFPKLHINSDKCEWGMECFEKWEYRFNKSLSDWAAAPKHDRYSHLMDAFIYVANYIEQVPSVKEGGNGGRLVIPSHYSAWGEDEVEDSWSDMPVGMRPSKFSKNRKKTPQEVYGKEFMENTWKIDPPDIDGGILLG